MSERIPGKPLAICLILAFWSAAGLAQFDEEKLVRDYAKTLAKDRDARERASAARWLGGRKQPEAVAALALKGSSTSGSPAGSAPSSAPSSPSPASRKSTEALDGRFTAGRVHIRV